jgi:tripartite-type tricarboxylate transporter receptor subunit TctC
MRRSFLSVALASLLALTAPALAQQASPGAETVQIVVPYSPGGLGDVIARALAPHLQARLGRGFVVINRAGASGMIGADAVAKARPDGRMLLLGYTSEIAINPGFYRDTTYRAEDFTPISLTGVSPLVVIARSNQPATSLRDFLAAARARPGGFTFASAGAGAPAHIAGELLHRRTGIEATHVPYRGGSRAVLDVLAGNVDIFFSGIAPALPHIRDGRVLAYAVTGDHRSAVLPEVPTMAEAGFEGFDLSGWFGLLAPANTPADIVQPLAAAVQEALRMEDVRQALVHQGVEVKGSSPAEFQAFITAEAAKYRELVRTFGITADP